MKFLPLRSCYLCPPPTKCLAFFNELQLILQQLNLIISPTTSLHIFRHAYAPVDISICAQNLFHMLTNMYTRTKNICITIPAYIHLESSKFSTLVYVVGGTGSVKKRTNGCSRRCLTMLLKTFSATHLVGQSLMG